LFINGIEKFSLAIQQKLLKFLQTNSITRIGGKQSVAINIRIITSSECDLQKLVEKGQFKNELYNRINIVTIKIPGLAERREDIPVLCNFYLQHLSSLHNIPIIEIGKDTMAIMQAYHWPSNINELFNILEWISIMNNFSSENNVIQPDMLPRYISCMPINGNSRNSFASKSLINNNIMTLKLKEARDIFEKQYLIGQINRFNGNISRTASFIGMERSALHRKLKYLMINNEQLEEN
ncbi:MAG: sigma 54-interacting transcriptional regulator, partial [Pseudomonadota bacterium]